MAVTSERILGCRLTDEALSDSRLYFFNIYYLFIYLVAPGFNCSMRDLLCVMWNHSLGPMDSGCGLWAQHLWGTSLDAPQWDLSSLTRDQTSHVPCIVRQILNHWTTREVPLWFSC